MRQEDSVIISTGKANMVEAQPHRVIKNAVKAIQDSCVITGFEIDFCQVCHSPTCNNGVDNFIAFYVQVINWFVLCNYFVMGCKTSMKWNKAMLMIAKESDIHQNLYKPSIWVMNFTRLREFIYVRAIK